MSGTTVLNRFRMGERLGTGGFGTVYRARDQRLERDVAVKVVETGPGSGPRVQREAQAAARLNHPGIVTLFEFAHHQFGPEGGRAYLVSELVDGETVRQLIDEDLLSDREIAEIGVDVCEALDHAHSRGVVHRDLKPSNLIVPFGRGGAKLMDFGIARLTDGDDLTGTGDVLGTLSYMSPEQAEGSTVGPPGDLYSLALTLYEAWSGANPRRHSNPSAAIRALETGLPSLAEHRPDLPLPVIELIDACLDREADYRPQIAELGRGLEQYLPELDRTVPDAAGTTGGFPFTGRSPSGTGFPRIAAAAGVGALAVTVMILSGGADPFSVVIAFIALSLVTLLRPRPGFLLAGVALTVWLAMAADMPGAAVTVALVLIPSALLIRGDGLALPLSGLGPLLGTLGMAFFLPFLAAFAPEWRDRLVVAYTGLCLTALAAAVTGRGLLPGRIPAAVPGWESSIETAFTGLLFPVFTAPHFLLSLAVWGLVAVLAGAVIQWFRLRRTESVVEPFLFAPVGSDRAPNAN